MIDLTEKSILEIPGELDISDIFKEFISPFFSPLFSIEKYSELTGKPFMKKQEESCCRCGGKIIPWEKDELCSSCYSILKSDYSNAKFLKKIKTNLKILDFEEVF